MSKLIKYILFSLFFLSNTLLFSQDKTQLEKEKQELETKIKETNNLLNKEKKKKNSALKQLELSNKKIKQHNQLLENLKESIDIQDSIINKKEEQIENLKESIIKKKEEQIENLKESIIKKKEELTLTQNMFSKIIYQTYVWKHTYNESFFLISSDNLNQLYKRKQYLNQLTEKTSKQIDNIKKIKEKLERDKEKLQGKKEEKERDKEKLERDKEKLQEKKEELENEKEELENEKDLLKQEKNNNSKIISEIKQNEKYYRNKLNQQKKKSKAIEERIKKIIEEEIKKSREEAEKNNSESPLTPEALKLSSNFTANKGNLPWPLEKGVIVSSFGIKKISGIETKNNGIDFSTEPRQNCRVVFSGTVSRIFEIYGGLGVLVNHGSYFTVYSVLKDVIVKSGDKVIAKQKIGTISTSEKTKETQLHFEIWEGKEPQNPVKWLYKAN